MAFRWKAAMLFMVVCFAAPMFVSSTAQAYDPYGVGIGGGGGGRPKPRKAKKPVYAYTTHPKYSNPHQRRVPIAPGSRRYRLVPYCRTGVAVRRGNRIQCWGCPRGFVRLPWKGTLSQCVKCPGGTKNPRLKPNGRYECFK